MGFFFFGFLRFAGMNNSQLKGFPTEPVRLSIENSMNKGRKTLEISI